MDTANTKAGTGGSGNTILVVEDEAEMLNMLVRFLSEQGHTVLGRTSASEACRLLDEHEVTLVIADWDLSGGRCAPEDSGCGSAVLEACRRRDRDIPVIVISGNRMIDARSDALTAQASSFLAKPFGLSLLARHVDYWLARNKPTSFSLSLAGQEDILTLDQVKQNYVVAVVRLLHGNVTEAARRLGVHRHTVGVVMAEQDRTELAEVPTFVQRE
jgi:DNA-binding NtrC family response regulator